MEGENLTHGGDHLRLMDYQPGHGIGLIIGQGPVGGAVKITDRHGPFNHQMPVLGLFERVIRVRVEFIRDLADDLFENVFERDQPLQ